MGPALKGLAGPWVTVRKEGVCVLAERLRGGHFSCPDLVTDLEEMQVLFIGTLEKSPNTRH